MIFRRDLAEVVQQLAVENGWEIHLAAMLAPIGYVTLPPEIVVKSREGRPLSKVEEHLMAGVPETAEGLNRLSQYVFPAGITAKISGDIIVEQNVHVIDYTNWVLAGHPLKASGACGRKGRRDQAQFAGYYVALDKGYYKDMGLDVEILPGIELIRTEGSTPIAEERYQLMIRRENRESIAGR